MVFEIPVIKISEHMTTSVWVCSDVHYGHKEHDEEHLQVYLDWLGGRCNKMIGLGDYLESAFPSSSGGKMMWDQILTPKEQINGFVDKLRPHKSQILGLATGNHERRMRNETSLDATELMCQLLDIPFLGYTGWLCLDSGKVQYYIHYHHGKGASTTAEYQLRKLENAGHHGADIRIIGHGHNLAWIPRTRMHVNREKGTIERRITHEIRTGGFLKDPEYAQIAMYPISSVGSPIIRLHPTKKIIDVRMGLTVDGKYGFEDLNEEI